MQEQAGQQLLFGSQETLPFPRIVAINSQKTAEKLFSEHDFMSLSGVTYVASLRVIDDYFNSYGFKSIELVIGDNVSEATLRGELKQADEEMIDRLTKRCQDGSLKILIPAKTDHSKFYMLEDGKMTRIIFGSANLTATGLGGKQRNSVMVWDLPRTHPFVNTFREYFEENHRAGCSLFMEDLSQMLNAEPDGDRKEIIRRWIETVPDETDREAAAILQDISATVLENNSQDTVEISVSLPPGPAQKRVMRLLGPISPSYSNSVLHLDAREFIRKVVGVPLMSVDLPGNRVLVNVAGAVEVRTESPENPELVDEALASVEDYINTVDLGVSSDGFHAKCSMYEALLYLLSAPFANEFMKELRKRQGFVSSRGPPFLYILGESNNGKSVFLKYALKLITGHNIEPLAGRDFSRGRIANARNSTAFPLVFDDLMRKGDFEYVLKNYWERDWSSRTVFPQLIMTSNSPKLDEWAKSRIKLLLFDVHFDPNNTGNKDRLNSLLSGKNDIFRWFSFQYLRHVTNGELISDDFLKAARDSMAELYEIAGRRRPDYFLNMPIENVYDFGRDKWIEAINLGKIEIREMGEELSANFISMEPKEFRMYDAYLPSSVASKTVGNTITIQNPDRFRDWLPSDKWHGNGKQTDGLLSRLRLKHRRRTGNG